MPGTIIERLSNRKLAFVFGVIVLIQVAAFFIGAIIAPAPSNTDQVTAVKCVPDDDSQFSIPRNTVHPPTPKNCHPISDPQSFNGSVVFAFQLPLPRENIILDYSRWMVNLLTVIIPDMSYADYMGGPLASKEGIDYVNGTVSLRVRLAVRKEDGSWHEYARKDLVKRSVNCWIPAEKRVNKEKYDCDMIQLFDLQSLYYDFYLINIQFTGGMENEHHHGLLTDLHLVAIHQNGGFTKIWLAMKTFFTTITFMTLMWFMSRLNQLNRPMSLLEKTLTILGLSLSQLNFPLEFLSLWVDFPLNNFLSDLRQGIFYCTLFSFWIIFTGEHLLDGINRSKLSSYHKQLGVVLVASTSLFIFDSIERGIQGYDPFFTIWEVDSHLANLVLVIAFISSALYFSFLCYHVYLVLANISSKRTSLPSMSLTRRLIYQGIIFRFKFLLGSTLVCAAFTLAAFLLGQWTEDPMMWDMDLHQNTTPWQWTSAMFTSVYAMWNCYVIMLLILYAPSHKEANTDLDLLQDEVVEFNRLTSDSDFGSVKSTSMTAAATASSANGSSTSTSSTHPNAQHEQSEMQLLQELTSKQALD